MDPANFGSTFWSSPQSDWNWPPPPEIDSAPYAASLDGAVLSLSGATAAGLGLAVEKRFSADREAGVVTVVYTLANRGSQARQVAPWEITRVAAGGLTFFPMGEGGPRKGPQDLLSPTIVNGVAWFAYDAAAITADQKLFADGQEGWIAHVDGDLLLVKSFADTPARAGRSGRGGDRNLRQCRPHLRRGREPGRLCQSRTRRCDHLDRALDAAQARPCRHARGVGSAPLLDLVRR